MALTFAQVHAVAHNNESIARVEVAIAAEAVNMANHANRAAFAQRVLHDPTKWATIMAVGVAVNEIVQTAPTDANIYNAVAGMWDAYAGAAA